MNARLHSVGYRPYEGERAGTFAAILAIAWDTARRALGLKRKARHKIAPGLAIFIAFVPAVVFVGVNALLGQAADIRSGPSYSEYFGVVLSALLLFAAVSAPEAICSDRMSDALSTFRTTILTKFTWLVGRVAGVTGLMLVVTLGPVLFLLLAYTLLDNGPDGFGDWILSFARIIVSSAFMSLLYALVASAVSMASNRRAIAAGIIVALLIVTPVLEGLTDNPNIIFIEPTLVGLETVLLIWGEALQSGASTSTVLAAAALWVLVPAGYLGWWARRR